MKKTIASFVLVGMFFMNTDVCGLGVGETKHKSGSRCSSCSDNFGFVHNSSGSTETDVRPFAEYVAEADATDQNYGQLMRIIGGENFKDSFAEDFAEDFAESWQTAVSLIKGLSDDDRYKLLGLCWCLSTYMYWQLSTGHEGTLGSDGHYHDPDLEKLEDNHKKIRYGECETYAEWVSDVLYSAAFYAYDAFSKASKASDDPENNCFRDDYVRSLLEEQRKNYKKKRNYKFSRIREVKTETEY